MTFNRFASVRPILWTLAAALLCAPQLSRASTDDPQPVSEAPAAETEAAVEDEEQPAGESPSQASPAKEGTKEKKVELKKVVVAEKRLELMVPATWKERARQNNIIEKEFAVYEVPLKEGEEPKEDTPSGRLTLSESGGSVEQNMRRWIGQFRLGRDADGEDAVQQEVIELEGATLHLLDISGTYFDAPRGPLGPKVERTDYRMLGAIIEIEEGPRYFVKFYGPQKIVAAGAKDFRKMVRTAKIAPAEAEATSKAEPAAEPKTDENKRDK